MLAVPALSARELRSVTKRVPSLLRRDDRVYKSPAERSRGIKFAVRDQPDERSLPADPARDADRSADARNQGTEHSWIGSKRCAFSSSSPSEPSAPQSAGAYGAEGSVIKLAWSETSQRLSRTAVDILGIGALEGRWATEFLAGCSITIAGGTSEVNKSILGERVLGLPREPRPTR